MSESLFQIVARYQGDLAKLQDLDLPPEVVSDTIEAMQGDVEEKVRAVVAFALQLLYQRKHGKFGPAPF